MHRVVRTLAVLVYDACATNRPPNVPEFYPQREYPPLFFVTYANR